MSLSTQYTQDYQQAVSAYMNGHYEAAVSATNQLLEDHPEDPNLRLLRGHIYYCLQQYQAANTEYKSVLDLTNDPELLSCAQRSLSETAGHLNVPALDDPISNVDFGAHTASFPQSLTPSQGLDEVSTQVQVTAMSQSTEPESMNPFVSDDVATDPVDIQEENYATNGADAAAEIPHLNLMEEDEDNTLLMNGQARPPQAAESSEFDASADQFDDVVRANSEQRADASMNGSVLNLPELELELDEEDDISLQSSSQTIFDSDLDLAEISDVDEHTVFPDFDMEDFTTDLGHLGTSSGLEDPDPLLSAAELETQTDPDLQEDYSGDLLDMDELLSTIDSDASLTLDQLVQMEPSLSVDTDAEGNPTPGDVVMPDDLTATTTRKQSWGLLAPYTNATLFQKQLIAAAATGVVSAAAVAAVGHAATIPQKASWSALGLSALAAGVAGGAITLGLGQILVRQIKVSTNDLHTQFKAVSRGVWTAKASELSQDEFGQLAVGFNQMLQYLETTTTDARRKAEEQEKAKEDLQRQVIRLLDDVEGAARGDLTVQAEVTADILGAVADSFNLTIYNLQKIVTQVKVAAREVTKSATDNESFARSLSADALRQAEELAVTLNSVQMMTTSIQKVAESARATDEVTKQASAAALKGGEAVESTVAGILEIRETVAETTRKVKRLAESSQEISKIVGLISQIASRTNLLALNASIEAARAGESGRGFAVVADEVRQLADRAAKASKEIEQIVLQIQGETSSVMTAMEEGTQQVIEGTQRAEQAKRSLEDIIQVSVQINQLVGSITQATAEQTETSRYVSQVMQSVELTAQETSQEAQRVSDSLHNLAGVAQDLQSSVERFRVEDTQF